MPNVTIYLDDKEYLIFMRLGEEQERKIKSQFKQSILRYDNVKRVDTL